MKFSRTSVLAIFVGAGLIAVGSFSARPPLPVAGQPEPTSPIITEPTPVPLPVFLPRLLRRFDPLLPDPLPTLFEGYVVKLTAEGRAACMPGTHVLQDKSEGFPGAKVHAALYSPNPEPEYNLDLYTGDYAEVLGLSSLAPDACGSLTWQLLTVTSIRRVIVPPGGSQPPAVAPTYE